MKIEVFELSHRELIRTFNNAGKFLEWLEHTEEVNGWVDPTQVSVNGEKQHSWGRIVEIGKQERNNN
jgi:hypothetical protein